MRLPQIVTYVAVKKALRIIKVSFGRTMMQALELLQLEKGTSPDEVTSQLVSQSVSQSVSRELLNKKILNFLSTSWQSLWLI